MENHHAIHGKTHYKYLFQWPFSIAILTLPEGSSSIFLWVFLWFSHEKTSIFLWFSYGFPMVFPWKNLHFPMVFLWFSYGFPMKTYGFPGALFCVSRGLNFFSSATLETFPDPMRGHATSTSGPLGSKRAKRQKGRETVVKYGLKYHANRISMVANVDVLLFYINILYRFPFTIEILSLLPWTSSVVEVHKRSSIHRINTLALEQRSRSRLFRAVAGQSNNGYQWYTCH